MKLYFNTQNETHPALGSKIKGFRFFFPIILFLGFGGCNHSIATDKLPTTQIVFGSGGGFTGRVHEYSLLEDGRIIAIKRDSATQKVIKKIDKNKVAQLYAQVDSMRLHTWLYDAPGNIYHYIIIKRDGKKDNKIVWDAGNQANVPNNIEAYYMQLRAQLPKKSNHQEHE